MTVVLESQKLVKGLKNFKQEFSHLNQGYDQLYNKYNNKKETFEYEVDKTSKEIEDHFNELIRKLNESKKKYIEAFKLRAKSEMKDFFEQYDNFGAFYGNVKDKHEEIQNLEELYESSNDFDLVKESALRDNDTMFKEFCPEYNESLQEYQEKLNDLDNKVNYTFHFHTGTNGDELIDNVHKNIKIKMKLEEENQPEEDIEREEEIKTESTPHPSRAKGETGHSEVTNYKQLYRVDKNKKRLLTYNFNDKKVHKIHYTEPETSEGPKEMEARHLSMVHKGLLEQDSKSVCMDNGDIYIFGASETKFSDRLYVLEGTELEECQNLPKKRKKVS